MEKLLKLFQKHKTGVIVLAVVLLILAVGLPVYLGLPRPENTTAPSQSQTTTTAGQSQTTTTAGQSQTTATTGQSQTTATTGQSQTTATTGQSQTTATTGQSQTTATPTTAPVQIGGRLSAGDKILLTVTAASFQDMYGYQFQVNYDKRDFEYTGGLKSEVYAISTIFAKPFEGYQMIGATMTGSKPGISGNNTKICVMEFKALKDCVLTDSMLGISKVNVVASDLKYTENVSGWSRKIDKF